ncbi:SRPBCC family protein [Flavivirga rizhaonensis]|uniref:SRPBCC domain-containing protein n=1 Tax=Flavivirga rizhaonensis TaxID=2559571 RepID=A0A4S1DZU3_9FLAO|nr:SRPBCC domain-containing protein [Flavivirga rizhaonensis]TGV03796.1 SRPBCC domain-containing protein [Flavivirga rizhaonensis]
MKKTLGLLTSALLVFSSCNNKTDKQQNQQEKMRTLKIVRSFDVEPEKVFGAFTNPDDMIVWWTPDTKFDIDLRVGGQYSITRKEGETTYVMSGKYLEVEQPRKLKYTCAMLDFSPIIDTLSVEIQPDGKGGSRLTFIQEGEGINEELKQLPEGTISEREKGWNLGFDLMAQSWKKMEN